MIDVEVEDPAWTSAIPNAPEIARRAASAVGTARAVGDFTILLTDDATVRDLNRRFRDQDDATNVLSFPAGPFPQSLLFPCGGNTAEARHGGDPTVRSESPDAAAPFVLAQAGATPPAGEDNRYVGPSKYLGDLALAYGVCAREAAAQNKTLASHLSHLVIHGVLHLLGYDHLDDADADRMEAVERTILARLNIADPYAGDDHVEPA